MKINIIVKTTKEQKIDNEIKNKKLADLLASGKDIEIKNNKIIISNEEIVEIDCNELINKSIKAILKERGIDTKNIEISFLQPKGANTRKK